MTFLTAEKDHGPGHAWLCLDQEAAPDWRLEIEREASKDLYLGPKGWQGTPFGIKAVAAKGDRLLLGPDVVDYLRDGDLIVLRIPEAAIEVEDYWPDIPISGRSNKGASLLDLPSEPEDEGPKAPFQPEDPIPQPQPVAPVITPPPSRGWLTWAAIAAALVIWFGMGAMVWLYSDELMALITGEPEQTETVVDQQPANEPAEEPTQTPAEEPIQAENTTDEATPPVQEADASTAPDTASPDTQTAQNDPPPATQSPAAPVHDRAYWQDMLGNSQLSGEALYGASRETRDDAELVDIAQDFLRLSADKGHKPAQQEYAGLFDPTKDAAVGSISAVKNPSTALEYYRRLSEAGDATASRNIESLCAHLKPTYFENAEARIAIDDYCN